jgi:hypothetical protein
MKVAHYTGDHAKDDPLVRLGWAITRKVQKGPYAGTTHSEAIHAEHGDGSVTIASSSLRDKGVRDKRTRLNPAHWRIVDVPFWDVRESIELLGRTRGAKYDLRGAIATAFIGSQDASRWFCNEWVAEPFVKASANFGPHQLHALTLSFGRDITLDFFRSRA